MDTSIAVDLVQLAVTNAYDVAVLVSGDAVLAPAVEAVHWLDKQVHVASWGGAGMSERLRAVAFDHIDLCGAVGAN